MAAGAAGSRQRFSGSAEELIFALGPVVGPLGRSWLRYCDSAKAHEAKLDVSEITKSHEVLSILHASSPKLAFTRSTIEKTVAGLLAAHEDAANWKLRDEDKLGYISTMTNRVLNMCRSVRQGETKNPGTGWVRALPWHGGAEKEDVAEPSDQSTAYLYGWDASVQNAWRARAGSKREKVMAVKITVPEGGAPTDAVIAEFADGSTWQVPDITIEEFTSSKDAAATAKRDQRVILWQGLHSRSHNEIKIVPKPDRSPLLVIMEQKKQVLQIRIDRCPSEAAALETAVQCAVKFMKDDIQREDLKAYRDLLMSSFVMPETKQKKAKAKAATKKPEVDIEISEAEDQSGQGAEEILQAEPIVMQGPPETDDEFWS